MDSNLVAIILYIVVPAVSVIVTRHLLRFDSDDMSKHARALLHIQEMELDLGIIEPEPDYDWQGYRRIPTKKVWR